MNQNIRNVVLKVRLSDSESLDFRRKCSRLGMQCATVARNLIGGMPARNDAPWWPKSEGPARGRPAPLPICPNRGQRAGGPKRWNL